MRCQCRIKKKEERGEPQDKVQAHNMKAVKNFRTKTDDAKKAGEAFRGERGDRTKAQHDKHDRLEDEGIAKIEKKNAKRRKHEDKATQAHREGDDKKATKQMGKAIKADSESVKAQYDTERHGNRRKGMNRVAHTYVKAKDEELDRQGEHNKAVRKLKKAAASTKEEKSGKKKSKKSTKKEGFFTDFMDSLMEPLYEVAGMPKCPPGYKWNNKTMTCEPKTEKDTVNGPRGQKNPTSGNYYNVIGSSGYDGGWAFEEPPTIQNLS